MAPYDTVSFLSDYGTADEFVGVVHSVVRSIAPHAAVIDINHQVPPHDIRAGSLSLVRSAAYLCPGVVLAVVDPGVGTARRAIAVEVGGGSSVLVGPDNGLLAPTVSMCGGAGRVVALTNTDFHLDRGDGVGATFAGRDVFAPVAAHLAAGVDLAELGPAVDPFTLTPGLIPLPLDAEEGGLTTQVLWVDRFGNAQLNVGPDDVAHMMVTTAEGHRQLTVRLKPKAGTIAVKGKADTVRTARVVATYGDLRGGEVGLVIDSQGLLSVAFDKRSAADELHLGAGSEVTLSQPR